MGNINREQPIDAQSLVSKLSLEMSIFWLVGVNISTCSDFSKEWEEARDDLGDALLSAQRVVGNRVKIGTIWVYLLVFHAPVARVDFWPLFEIGFDPLDQPMSTLRAFFRPLIARAQRERSKGQGERLIHRLLDSTTGKPTRL